MLWYVPALLEVLGGQWEPSWLGRAGLSSSTNFTKGLEKSVLEDLPWICLIWVNSGTTVTIVSTHLGQIQEQLCSRQKYCPDIWWLYSLLLPAANSAVLRVTAKRGQCNRCSVCGFFPSLEDRCQKHQTGPNSELQNFLFRVSYCQSFMLSSN